MDTVSQNEHFIPLGALVRVVNRSNRKSNQTVLSRVLQGQAENPGCSLGFHALGAMGTRAGGWNQSSSPTNPKGLSSTATGAVPCCASVHLLL